MVPERSHGERHRRIERVGLNVHRVARPSVSVKETVQVRAGTRKRIACFASCSSGQSSCKGTLARLGCAT
jgi:hypothetical protein